MKSILAHIFFTLLVGVCMVSHAADTTASVEQPKNPAVARVTNRTLIMATGYYDPNKDTVGINKLTERVTQAFSSELQPKLVSANKMPINVNDKSLQYPAGERLALHASENDADSAVLVSISTPLKNGEYSIYLRVQYFELRIMMKDGKSYSILPTNELERSYYLRGPEGDTKFSFEELAQQFFIELKSSGRLQ
jgi:hypothetical protein